MKHETKSQLQFSIADLSFGVLVGAAFAFLNSIPAKFGSGLRLLSWGFPFTYGRKILSFDAPYNQMEFNIPFLILNVAIALVAIVAAIHFSSTVRRRRISE